MSSLTAGTAHRRVRWQRPAGKRRPGVIDATRAELVRGLELRHGSLWMRVSRAVAIAGYPLARTLNRVRALRSDGAESLLAMTVALLYLADVRTGFVGKPRPTGGPWQRYTLQDLAQMAYGGQTEAELRRARRSLDMMVSLGWASPTKQTRRHIGDGQFRSDAGVRRLNLDRLCQMTGTSWLLSRDRQHADRKRGPVLGSVATGPKGRVQRVGAFLAPADTLSEAGPAERVTGPPERRTESFSGPAAISEILKLLAQG